MIEPSSSSRVGILLSGLKRMTSALVSLMVTLTRCSAIRSAMPSSWATTTTLRTKGERDDHSSFTRISPRSSLPHPRDRRTPRAGIAQRPAAAVDLGQEIADDAVIFFRLLDVD